MFRIYPINDGLERGHCPLAQVDRQMIEEGINPAPDWIEFLDSELNNNGVPTDTGIDYDLDQAASDMDRGGSKAYEMLPDTFRYLAKNYTLNPD